MSDTNGLNSFQDRMETIFQIVSKQGSARVADLQDILGVSDMTIRRCLNAMASDGLIRRVHGGAASIEGAESRFMVMRNSLNANIKALLADRAIGFIPENGSVYLDSGTTCFAVAKRLATSGKTITIITDSIKITRELQGVRNLTTTLLGGMLCDDMTTLDGPLTAEAAGRITLDICLFSADSFNAERLDNRYLAGAMTKKIVIARSDRSLCICDSSKYNKRCCFMFCGWDEVDMFLTDSYLPPKARRAIAEKGVEVHIVSEASESA
ncbi:MAG: DeoR/GlpR family DNA-binding transcription regulator [Planctomycetota bacterium]|jgi:DeoR family fructose operon transcriptional repressor|nr:DeoR/GlpR family DNA-binding transcription regulator [Planctomycetota bacterium]